MDLSRIHKKSIHNKHILEESSIIGCFHCLKYVSLSDVKEWVDGQDTAICPFCGVDSLIGDGVEISVDDSLLRLLHQKYF